MKAVRIHRFGGPDVLALEEIEPPIPESGQVLVRVAGSGVGPWDAWIRSGQSVLPQPLPLTIGSDIAGVIESVGPQVHDLHVGQKVFGVTNRRFTGGYAEYAIADAGMISGMPAGLTFTEAASVPVIAVTALQMLFEHAQLSEGQAVLILGAEGNVGRYAVQLAQIEKLQVRTLSRADKEEAKLDSLACSVDAVIDTVGGDTQTRALRALKSGGILVSAVSAPNEAQLIHNHVSGHFMLVDVSSARLSQISDLLQDGKLTPAIGQVLPLASARIAHEMLDGSRSSSRGKIVLTP